MHEWYITEELLDQVCTQAKESSKEDTKGIETFYLSESRSESGDAQENGKTAIAHSVQGSQYYV